MYSQMTVFASSIDPHNLSSPATSTGGSKAALKKHAGVKKANPENLRPISRDQTGIRLGRLRAQSCVAEIEHGPETRARGVPTIAQHPRPSNVCPFRADSDGRGLNPDCARGITHTAERLPPLFGGSCLRCAEKAVSGYVD